MKEPSLLPSISFRDLNRRPAEVLQRVARGERLVVCRYGKPLATLQPIDGFVTNHRDGREFDIYGFPLGSMRNEAAKLSDMQKKLLRGVNRLNQVTIIALEGQLDGSSAAMEDLVLRGLAKRRRGLYLTGRGMVIREWLLEQEAQSAFGETGSPQCLQ